MGLFIRIKNNKKPVLRQIIDLVPLWMLDSCTKQFKTDKGCSKYKTYDQFVALTFGQLNKCYTLSDISTGIGVYTILYFTLTIFTKNQNIKTIDEEATKLISLIGILFAITWIISIVVELNVLNEEDKALMLKRICGKYWFGFWIQPLLWIAITQALRYTRIRKNALIRLIMSVFLLLSIEKMIIIITSFHRDYLPSSWTMYNELDIYPSNFILAILFKITVFLLIVGIYYIVKQKIRK
jgi:molybdopterin-containing oxidoreductase family membrane subunit